MWFWWFMLLCDLLIPALMIICGRLMWKRPPKKINVVLGYRTNRSMRNMDTWNFAHEYCGKLWWKIGWIILIVSFAAHLPFANGSDNTLGILGAVLCGIQCILLILCVFQTERTIDVYFTKEGHRK